MLFRVLTNLVPQWVAPLLADLSAPGVSPAEWIEAACMAVAVVMGLIAIVTRRGRAEASAAIVLASSGTSLTTKR